MATCIITEFNTIASGAPGYMAQLAMEPAVTTQTVTYTTATQSSAFNALTRLVKLHPSANCRVVFGTNPTAVATSEFLIANTDHWRGVFPGHKVSVYDGSS